jgi:hypothetical protein
MGLFGGTGDGGAADAEKARQANIQRGMSDIDQKFSKFDDKFYNQRAEDYTKAQTPRMMEDFNTTKNNLTYALARSGNMNSSTGVNRNTSLNTTLADNESQIANNAQGQANDLRGKVATQKGQLVSELEASGDPAATAIQSNAAMSQLRAPSAIQPLGNMFADWSNLYLAKQYSQANQNQGNVWNQLSMGGYGGASPAGGSSSWVN